MGTHHPPHALQRCQEVPSQQGRGGENLFHVDSGATSLHRRLGMKPKLKTLPTTTVPKQWGPHPLPSPQQQTDGEGA